MKGVKTGGITLALLLSLVGGGYAAPTVPDSQPDKDEIVAVCDEGSRGVYAHAWLEQKVMIFGSVYKGNKHDPATVILTWKDEPEEGTPDTLWVYGVEIPKAEVLKWLEETDLCDASKAPRG